MQSVLILVVALISTYCAAELTCGAGETKVNCPDDCGTDHCPKNENYDRSCKTPKECKTPACKCTFNYSRAKNGTCIPTRECPPFPCTRPNEVYVSCPSYCPTDDCKQATPDGRCPLYGHILMTVECEPTCRCKTGYWRKNGVCVPFNECPKHE